MTLFNLHLSEDQARVKQFIEKKATETTHCFAHLTKDGRQLDVELVIDKAEHQGRPAWIVIMRGRNGHEQIKAELEKRARRRLNRRGRNLNFRGTSATRFARP
jgi:hypothetical protein